MKDISNVNQSGEAMSPDAMAAMIPSPQTPGHMVPSPQTPHMMIPSPLFELALSPRSNGSSNSTLGSNSSTNSFHNNNVSSVGSHSGKNVGNHSSHSGKNMGNHSSHSGKNMGSYSSHSNSVSSHSKNAGSYSSSVSTGSYSSHSRPSSVYNNVGSYPTSVGYSSSQGPTDNHGPTHRVGYGSNHGPAQDPSSKNTPTHHGGNSARNSPTHFSSFSPRDSPRHNSGGGYGRSNNGIDVVSQLRSICDSASGNTKFVLNCLTDIVRVGCASPAEALALANQIANCRNPNNAYGSSDNMVRFATIVQHHLMSLSDLASDKPRQVFKWLVDMVRSKQMDPAIAFTSAQKVAGFKNQDELDLKSVVGDIPYCRPDLTGASQNPSAPSHGVFASAGLGQHNPSRDSGMGTGSNAQLSPGSVRSVTDNFPQPHNHIGRYTFGHAPHRVPPSPGIQTPQPHRITPSPGMHTPQPHRITPSPGIHAPQPHGMTPSAFLSPVMASPSHFGSTSDLTAYGVSSARSSPFYGQHNSRSPQPNMISPQASVNFPHSPSLNFPQPGVNNAEIVNPVITIKQECPSPTDDRYPGEMDEKFWLQVSKAKPDIPRGGAGKRSKKHKDSGPGVTRDSGSGPGVSKDAEWSMEAGVTIKKESVTDHKLPPCYICGEKASGLHYGVNTCEACKGFYRRMHKKGGVADQCSRSGTCDVTGDRRNSCSWCRYQKCLKLGMSHGAIKTGRYTHEKRTKDTLEIRKFLGLEEEVEDPGVPEYRPTPFESNEEMDAVIDELVRWHDELVRNNSKRPKEQIYAMNTARLMKEAQETNQFGSTNISKEEYKSLEAVGLEKLADDRKQLMSFHINNSTLWIRKFIDWAKKIPGFQKLHMDDRTVLIKYSRIEVWFLGSFPGYDSVRQVALMPNETSLTKKEMLRAWSSEYIETCYAMAERFQQIDVTPEELVLLKCVCLFGPDRGEPMKDRDQVHAMMEHYANMLLYLLEKNRQDAKRKQAANVAFWQLMGMLTRLRNVQHAEMANLEDEQSVYNFKDFQENELISCCVPAIKRKGGQIVEEEKEEGPTPKRRKIELPPLCQIHGYDFCPEGCSNYKRSAQRHHPLYLDTRDAVPEPASPVSPIQHQEPEASGFNASSVSSAAHKRPNDEAGFGQTHTHPQSYSHSQSLPNAYTSSKGEAYFRSSSAN